MLFLISLGLVVGPGLGILKATDIEPLAPFLSTLAVVIILFDGGLGLNIQKAVGQAPRAIVLAVLGFGISVAATTLFLRYLLGWQLLEGALLGSMIGGSSSIVVIALVGRLSLSDRGKTTLILESSTTDVLAIVTSITLMEILTTGVPPLQGLASEMTARFTTGIVLGGLIGLVWLNILPRLSDEPYRYMVTLGSIFLTYFASESLGGSGAISALMFGMVLANSGSILVFLRRRNNIVVDKSFTTFEAEIVFLIKAFFFVYLGLIVAIPSLQITILALAISFVLLAARSLGVVASTVGSDLAREKGAMTSVYGRGLAAAILSVLPAQYGLPNSDVYTTITLLVIVFTTIITSLGAARFRVSSNRSSDRLIQIAGKTIRDQSGDIAEGTR